MCLGILDGSKVRDGSTIILGGMSLGLGEVLPFNFSSKFPDTRFLSIYLSIFPIKDPILLGTLYFSS